MHQKVLDFVFTHAPFDQNTGSTPRIDWADIKQRACAILHHDHEDNRSTQCFENVRGPIQLIDQIINKNNDFSN